MVTIIYNNCEKKINFSFNALVTLSNLNITADVNYPDVWGWLMD